MNRHVRLALIMAVATTAIIAIAAVAWRAYLIEGQGVIMRPRPLAPVILFAVPLILRHPRCSRPTPRVVQAGNL